PERVPGALEPPLPAVRACERLRRRGVTGGELRERSEALPLRRRLLERPGQRRERAPPRPPPYVLRLDQRLTDVPDRAHLTRPAVVVGRLAHEIEPLRGARARGVEEVPIARDSVLRREPRAPLVEPAAHVVVEERRAGAAARQASLLQPEDEDS